MNLIFLLLLCGGILAAALRGSPEVVTGAALNGAAAGVQRIWEIMGVLCFWLGIAKVAEKAGIIQGFSRLLAPFIHILFPGVPRSHPALGSILLNMTANFFGLGSAATPFGLRAMQQLQELNRKKDAASAAMCTFLALNTSALALPFTMVAIRATAGAKDPADIIVPSFLANCAAACVAISADWCCRQWVKKRGGY
ncbi:MAG: nucleoside recognition domain-containing protein [Bacillota bacterium]|nr:nucleoside recognition domain-containing protein [Bacillota bacterium]